MKFAIGDRIRVINDNESMWTRIGASGVIIEQHGRGIVRVMFDRGDYDSFSDRRPYSWLVSTINIRKIERIKNKYKLSVIR